MLIFFNSVMPILFFGLQNRAGGITMTSVSSKPRYPLLNFFFSFSNGSGS